MKKAQITLFIIIGIAILLGAGLLYYANTKYKASQIGKEVKETQAAAMDITSAKKYIQNCVEDLTKKGAGLIASQGGYYKKYNQTLEANFGNVSFAYYYGRKTLPNIEFIHKELKEYLSDGFGSCLKQEVFLNSQIKADDPITQVKIQQNKITVGIKYEVNTNENTSNAIITEQEISINSLFGQMFVIMSEIVDNTQKDPDWIDLSYLSSFENIKTDILPFNDSTILYSLTDKTALEPYSFVSAFSFTKNSAPVIEFNDVINLKDGVPYAEKVIVTDPENDKFSCEDNTFLFDITPDCGILFTPEIPGYYNITIRATDSKGNFAKKEVLFIIK